MARKRFRADERDALTHGVRVEWCNATRWQHYGTVVGTITRDEYGWDSVPIRDEAVTRTGSGPVHDLIYMPPGKVRLPATEVANTRV